MTPRHDAPTGRTGGPITASLDVLLSRSDAQDVTEACSENQRATSQQTIESMAGNGTTTFGQCV